MQTADSNISWDQLRFPFYIVYVYDFNIKSFCYYQTLWEFSMACSSHNNHKILLINLEAFIVYLKKLKFITLDVVK